MSVEVDRALGGRPLKDSSPESKGKDHRDFADKVKCPLCGEMFEDEAKIPDEVGRKSGHMQCLEHHADEHPDEKWRGVVAVNKSGWNKEVDSE
jgi:hypothetical protein